MGMKIGTRTLHAALDRTESMGKDDSPSSERACLVSHPEEKREFGRAVWPVVVGVSLLLLGLLSAFGAYFLTTDEGAAEFKKDEVDMQRLAWRMMHPPTRTSTTSTTAPPIFTFVTAETRG